nr:MAG TPA: hypothetical protein [Caudoviricetes sp.]
MDTKAAFNANIYKDKIIKNSTSLVWSRCLPAL